MPWPPNVRSDKFDSRGDHWQEANRIVDVGRNAYWRSRQAGEDENTAIGQALYAALDDAMGYSPPKDKANQ
jgi:hypothetical protein